MKNLFFPISILCFIVGAGANAQVTIGSGLKPNTGALLDLKQYDDPQARSGGRTSDKGLLCPRVKLLSNSNVTALGVDAAKQVGATGLLVYNTNQVQTSPAAQLCRGLHIWDGTKWQPLLPYPMWDDILELVTDQLVGFSHITTTNDPLWATMGKNPADYPLGYMSQFVDKRAGDVEQKYHYSRYYVGVQKRMQTYKKFTSLSCDKQHPNYQEAGMVTKPYMVFEDGVWMNENLRAEKVDTKRDHIGDVAITLQGNNLNPGGILNLAAWAYPNNLVAQKNRVGLLYTWTAATNGKQAVDSEAGLKEGPRTQGICPSGWHVPSDRQWTDLENAIRLNPKKFSTTTTIGGALTIYGEESLGEIGRSLKSQASSVYGTSLSALLGGFDAPLAGNAASGSIEFFGKLGVYWSSSPYSSSFGQNRALNRDTHIVMRNALRLDMLISVRCKRTF